MACATGRPSTPPLAPLRKKNWFVYAKPPFARPEAVLAYLARYTHRVAISNSRLLALDERGVTFRYKDYRRNGQARYRTMTLAPHEFIRRFLLHVLPKGFHRIRHYGLLASAGCKANIARARELVAAPAPPKETPAEHDNASTTCFPTPALSTVDRPRRAGIRNPAHQKITATTVCSVHFAPYCGVTTL